MQNQQVHIHGCFLGSRLAFVTMSYFPVLPGAVDDSATPAPSPKMHGLHGHDAGDIEAPRAPVRNVVLTVEQKEKLQQWQRMAEHGFQIHRRAERYYEHVNFWTLSLPSVVLSAVATVWTLATENSQFENSRVYIASISGLGTIVTSIGTYWRWQARMEKNRFASERYNSLTNRLTLLKARLQMGDIEFAHVLQEVESTIHEILKTCGPPDLWVQQRFEWEEKTSQYELLDRLTNLRDVSPWVRCCFPCCWQTVTKLCRRRTRGNGEDRWEWFMDRAVVLWADRDTLGPPIELEGADSIPHPGEDIRARTTSFAGGSVGENFPPGGQLCEEPQEVIFSLCPPGHLLPAERA
ncbi:hypothetical protein AK812_SmicGene12065 [Symbiodinium microadriaticum]|uniref:Uncharacterized protein n=1 Tax=Symbiodinium microadriaticum TaxID=2951 RepID=A0A1Q9EBN0_SYMMI|nr:hypothetical protein AK812_SmicGene12065 [Symbiodinium microadriaticum]CAE7262988.1 unnamed protein product [Symbiodinium microadriaticum]